MKYELARFVAWVDPREVRDPSFIDEVKGLTFSRYAEFAVLSLDDGRHALIRGGRTGVLFELDAEGRMIVETPAGRQRVVELLWHTHPIPTGPSDHDRGVLRLLDQRESIVYEIKGERDGTRFSWRKGRSDERESN